MGKPTFNLFEPHVQQEAVKGQLFLQIHGGDQGLVTPGRSDAVQAGASVSRSFLTQSIQGSGGMCNTQGKKPWETRSFPR